MDTSRFILWDCTYEWSEYMYKEDTYKLINWHFTFFYKPFLDFKKTIVEY